MQKAVVVRVRRAEITLPLGIALRRVSAFWNEDGLHFNSIGAPACGLLRMMMNVPALPLGCYKNCGEGLAKSLRIVPLAREKAAA